MPYITLKAHFIIKHVAISNDLTGLINEATPKITTDVKAFLIKQLSRAILPLLAKIGVTNMLIVVAKAEKAAEVKPKTGLPEKTVVKANP